MDIPNNRAARTHWRAQGGGSIPHTPLASGGRGFNRRPPVVPPPLCQILGAHCSPPNNRVARTHWIFLTIAQLAPIGARRVGGVSPRPP